MKLSIDDDGDGDDDGDDDQYPISCHFSRVEKPPQRPNFLKLPFRFLRATRAEQSRAEQSRAEQRTTPKTEGRMRASRPPESRSVDAQ